LGLIMFLPVKVLNFNLKNSKSAISVFICALK
jgi:hypothetical protein